MQACLRCGKKTEGDCLLWKGGVSQVLCPDCMREEEKRKIKELVSVPDLPKGR